jgi:predicted ArsR family transcriptional regulator
VPHGEQTEELGSRTWTFLTNHARVLICIARDPTRRIRDIAEEIGITERAAQFIIADLEQAEYLSRKRVGRRNTYSINLHQPFRHRAESDHAVQELISVFVGHDRFQSDHESPP